MRTGISPPGIESASLFSLLPPEADCSSTVLGLIRQSFVRAVRIMNAEMRLMIYYE